MIYTLASETYNYEISFLQSDPLYGYHVQDEQLKEMPNKYPAFASLLIVPANSCTIGLTTFILSVWLVSIKHNC